MTQRITKTMQNSMLDETVDSLLKLALLIENGGILIGHLPTLFVDDKLKWL